MTSSINPIFNENMWVIQIRRTLGEELEEDTEFPVNIFNVPKALMADKPNCYIPQEVAIGPLHRLRPELYETERYKLAAAKRTQKNILQGVTFQRLVDDLAIYETRIRACYHRFLRCNGDTLAWMMAIDACFLLDFLHVYAIKAGRPSAMTGAGTKSVHNAILRDIVMVENQIPLFVLRKVLEFQFPTLDHADDMLRLMLAGFGEDFCPFPTTINLSNVEEQAHLLDFLYHVVVPRSKESPQVRAVNNEEDDRAVENEADELNENREEESSIDYTSYVKQLSPVISGLLSTFTQGVMRVLKGRLFSKPIKLILNFPWEKLFNLLELSIFSKNKEENGNSPNSNISNAKMARSPLMEEIAIPSVSELSKSGIQFSPTNAIISSIAFDCKKATLYLPTISLDINTEVILRNLVAYESLNTSGPLVITRYSELLNGIIDTKEDAKILRERGIILNHLKSDEEVANMWNGMSKSVRLTKVPFLDKVIEDVNKYHSGLWKVKAGKLMKRYVFGSWQLLIFLATVSLLLLMVLQAFCSVYSCPRTFKVPE